MAEKAREQTRIFTEAFDWLTGIPWSPEKEDNLDLAHADFPFLKILSASAREGPGAEAAPRDEYREREVDQV